MTGFIVNVFPFRNRVSPKEAFEGLELGEGKPSRPVLRGPGGRKAAWLLGRNANGGGGGIREDAVWDEIRLNSFAGRSLHCGLNASPTASQASVPRVASENKSCSNDGTVGE